MYERKKLYTNLYIKRRILQLKNSIVQVISNGIITRTPKRMVMIQIKNQIDSLSVQLGLSNLEKNRLFISAENEYNRITRKAYARIRVLNKHNNLTKQTVDQTVYTCIRTEVRSNDLIKETNSVMYDYEFRTKHDSIYGREGLLATATSPFFLCSSHPNSAKGHADYEGKMYYDKDWEEKGNYTEKEKSSIRAMIRNRKLMTVQWVLGEPVYLCTRRNCKHYLINIPLSEALHASPRSLLKKHGLYMKESEPVSNEILMYREYYNRLKVEEALLTVIPNKILEVDISNDKKLLNKWRQKL